jgi:hypothetical protein
MFRCFRGVKYGKNHIFYLYKSVKCPKKIWKMWVLGGIKKVSKTFPPEIKKSIFCVQDFPF